MQQEFAVKEQWQARIREREICLYQWKDQIKVDVSQVIQVHLFQVDPIPPHHQLYKEQRLACPQCSSIT